MGEHLTEPYLVCGPNQLPYRQICCIKGDEGYQLIIKFEVATNSLYETSQYSTIKGAVPAERFYCDYVTPRWVSNIYLINLGG